ncbi:50S ribosomal protein L11 methyltransferase [Immundisolibacter sp.]|uniref:50S ribosomal protein L11 methyltransferase n=1 Tax=Immundisolibacter sp. TaxID=1934948 RepID=UPI00262DD5C7|nr:50S ribosomal protein L11 methyltransferase [Immundisolibacter sp.]MDD3650642.1 50S ribosomal protein L11 methyltransferase [Immundisolibacter sp.]
MGFVSIKCRASAAQHDALCGVFEQAGAVAVTTTDAADRPVLEPAPGQTPLWPEVEITALFDGDHDCEPLLALLAALGAQAVSCERVPEQDWARSGQDVTARHFGGRLWVCPTDAAVPAPDAVVVRLDAGLGFGTGAHPTTALCLRWLAAHPPVGAEVIDWGCGSGILAVAAALLGARCVWAIDIDPQARTAAAANAARNGVADRVQVLAADALPAVLAVDLILANILAPVLVQLAPRLLAALRPGGTVVLSGLLEAQVPQVVAAFTPAVHFAAPAIEQGWACLAGVKS